MKSLGDIQYMCFRVSVSLALVFVYVIPVTGMLRLAPRAVRCMSFRPDSCVGTSGIACVSSMQSAVADDKALEQKAPWPNGNKRQNVAM